MRKPFLYALLLALVALPLRGEVQFNPLSVTQTVTSYSFPPNTRAVLVISDGPDDCFYRLFHNAETSGNATTSSIEIKSGESKTYVIGTQGPGTSWRTLSAICDTGDTATFRIESF